MGPHKDTLHDVCVYVCVCVCMCGQECVRGCSLMLLILKFWNDFQQIMQLFNLIFN